MELKQNNTVTNLISPLFPRCRNTGHPALPLDTPHAQAFHTMVDMVVVMMAATAAGSLAAILIALHLSYHGCRLSTLRRKGAAMQHQDWIRLPAHHRRTGIDRSVAGALAVALIAVSYGVERWVSHC